MHCSAGTTTVCALCCLLAPVVALCVDFMQWQASTRGRRALYSASGAQSASLCIWFCENWARRSFYMAPSELRHCLVCLLEHQSKHDCPLKGFTWHGDGVLVSPLASSISNYDFIARCSICSGQCFSHLVMCHVAPASFQHQLLCVSCQRTPGLEGHDTAEGQMGFEHCFAGGTLLGVPTAGALDVGAGTAFWTSCFMSDCCMCICLERWCVLEGLPCLAADRQSRSRRGGAKEQEGLVRVQRKNRSSIGLHGLGWS